MEQMEFNLGEQFRRYDIFSDSLRPLNPRDLEIYQAIYDAYARTREAAGKFPAGPLALVLNDIHHDLVKRILSK